MTPATGQSTSGGVAVTPAAASPFLTEHLKSFVDYPPRQKADSLSAKAAIDRAQKALAAHN